MKIVNLTYGSEVYTSNAYLLTGTWNALPDVNTLIDTGRDVKIIDAIHNAPTGVGKRKLDQVILTHTHYDHVSMLPKILKEFNPVVCGYSPNFDDINHVLKDGEHIQIADLDAEVIYTPGHSNDSLCLYCQGEGIFFSGDTEIIIRTGGNTYEKGFITAIERISGLDITAIYPGHGRPILSDCNKQIRQSLVYVRA
jgi:glyoxylase-like metal-dependent hydrolase (beta-lactamase superfamily II)